MSDDVEPVAASKFDRQGIRRWLTLITQSEANWLWHFDLFTIHLDVGRVK
ncbi:hypothetical protein IQ268_30165 [Oculatella sp. LEGE 06141]|nr:hypothetical protein [Oculatella sp. LEGE 06141]MBE9182805.1 hypothetical protein [Oculatella sp. LEGE 06141]